ncbi:MAG: hypothetical protein R2755_02630 [Acidimicrobiales bacterium]
MRSDRLRPDEPSGGIDLTQEHLKSIAYEVMMRQGSPQQPFGLYVFASQDDGAELARAVERRVFDDAYGNGPAVMSSEYAPYEFSSLFTCIIDHKRLIPVAATRLIGPGGLGWKTMDDLARIWGVPGPIALHAAGLKADPTRLWDCATLAVEPAYRKAFLVQATIGSMGVVTGTVGTEIALALMDTKALRVVQHLCGRPFSALAGFEARQYLDSPATLPVWTDVPAFRRRLADTGDAALGVMFLASYFEPAVRGLVPGDIIEALARNDAAR